MRKWFFHAQQQLSLYLNSREIHLVTIDWLQGQRINLLVYTDRYTCKCLTIWKHILLDGVAIFIVAKHDWVTDVKLKVTITIKQDDWVPVMSRDRIRMLLVHDLDVDWSLPSKANNFKTTFPDKGCLDKIADLILNFIL